MSNYIECMNRLLNLKDYRDDIKLFEPYIITSREINRSDIVEILLDKLYERDINEVQYEERRTLLRGLLNQLKPLSLNADDLELVDQLLIDELKDKVITNVNDLEVKKSIKGTKLSVWLGDITTVDSDVIINAANNRLLGCFTPLHLCIDNAIHSGAGPRLRDDCEIIMRKQGFLEPTGMVKVTRAYNLPSRFVFHTVGPIVEHYITEQNREDLQHCYINCLEMCREISAVRTITFCSISTGVFGYPVEFASKVAIETVSDWLEINPGYLDRVVFNVFSEKDKNCYDFK